MLLHKAFETEHTHELNPDLPLIRKYAMRDVAASEVWCGALKTAHTRVDRSGERFTKAYLQRFAETLPGKPLLEGHDTTKRPIGRIYAAEVIPEGDHWFLKSRYFLRADSPVVADVELGIAKDCSVGFNAGRRVCDLDGKVWLPNGRGECRHSPLQEYDGQVCTITYCDTEVHKAEGMEVSLVWVGCQQGAEAIPKSLAELSLADIQRYFAIPFAPHPEEPMEIKEALAEIERLKALTAPTDREQALADELAGFKAREGLIKEAESHREDLRKEIVRMASVIDETNAHITGKVTTAKLEMYTKLLAHMKEADSASLKAVMEGIRPDFNAATKESGAEHNGPPPDETPGIQKPGRASLLQRVTGGLV